MKKKAPHTLKHKPIISVDYERLDESGDAKFLSLGVATWNTDDYSLKVIRTRIKDRTKWSRESEELPLWRVLDLAILLTSVIYEKKSFLNEQIQDPDKEAELNEFIKDNMEMFIPRLEELKRILQCQITFETSTHTPNIFDFATSELSQDALFCWLIQWADTKYKVVDEQLHNIGQDFLSLLCGKKVDINSVTVRKQWNNIDIGVIINDKLFLVIEDKTETTIHDNQLARYKQEVERNTELTFEDFYFAYVKTGNEPSSILKQVKSNGYNIILRANIIECLNKYDGENPILSSFFEHLKKIENETNNFRMLPPQKWSFYAWQGFYKELENELDITDWGYVPNPSGGFWGAWWHFKDIVDEKDVQMYLQFEELKLCIKISCKEKQNRSDIRNRLSDLVRSKRTFFIKPNRFGAGRYMTIAVVKDFFGTGLINIKEIVQQLKEYEKIVDECCKS